MDRSRGMKCCKTRSRGSTIYIYIYLSIYAILLESMLKVQSIRNKSGVWPAGQPENSMVLGFVHGKIPPAARFLRKDHRKANGGSFLICGGTWHLWHLRPPLPWITVIYLVIPLWRHFRLDNGGASAETPTMVHSTYSSCHGPNTMNLPWIVVHGMAHALCYVGLFSAVKI